MPSFEVFTTPFGWGFTAFSDTREGLAQVALDGEEWVTGRREVVRMTRRGRVRETWEEERGTVTRTNSRLSDLRRATASQRAEFRAAFVAACETERERALADCGSHYARDGRRGDTTCSELDRLAQADMLLAAARNV